MKVLVTGSNGQLGYDVVKKLNSLNIETIATTRKDFDLTNNEDTFNYITRKKPDIIVHCAAYTAVDKAEEEKELCYKVNVEGTKNIVNGAKNQKIKMLYVSTDYVFDGKGSSPHKEDKKTDPVNYYGYTKELGEQTVKENLSEFFIVRTSWVYGINGNNFVKTMLRLSENNKELSVVSDQVGAPTYTKDLAEFIVNLIQTDKYGVYHGVNEGYCSWYEFAKEIFEEANIDIKVNKVKTKDYPTKATRPLNSKLSKSNTDKANLKRLPHWKDALSRFIKELKMEEI